MFSSQRLIVRWMSPALLIGFSINAASKLPPTTFNSSFVSVRSVQIRLINNKETRQDPNSHCQIMPTTVTHPNKGVNERYDEQGQDFDPDTTFDLSCSILRFGRPLKVTVFNVQWYHGKIIRTADSLFRLEDNPADQSLNKAIVSGQIKNSVSSTLNNPRDPSKPLPNGVTKQRVWDSEQNRWKTLYTDGNHALTTIKSPNYIVHGSPEAERERDEAGAETAGVQ